MRSDTDKAHDKDKAKSDDSATSAVRRQRGTSQRAGEGQHRQHNNAKRVHLEDSVFLAWGLF